ncbi:hypothetical protein B0A49_03699 [Cryomyces minteri]|uniref:Uncharacterized protein n=1 Tax=Cryomyces minteri TaxID=331657 RepID=A0A4U0XMM0_9PEZI|nr:hypothetical protein B0A49_03699 [Cryomyces minteri]
MAVKTILFSAKVRAFVRRMSSGESKHKGKNGKAIEQVPGTVPKSDQSGSISSHQCHVTIEKLARRSSIETLKRVTGRSIDELDFCTDAGPSSQFAKERQPEAHAGSSGINSRVAHDTTNAPDCDNGTGRGRLPLGISTAATRERNSSDVSPSDLAPAINSMFYATLPQVASSTTDGGALCLDLEQGFIDRDTKLSLTRTLSSSAEMQRFMESAGRAGAGSYKDERRDTKLSRGSAKHLQNESDALPSPAASWFLIDPLHAAAPFMTENSPPSGDEPVVRHKLSLVLAAEYRAELPTSPFDSPPSANHEEHQHGRSVGNVHVESRKVSRVVSTSPSPAQQDSDSEFYDAQDQWTRDNDLNGDALEEEEAGTEYIREPEAFRHNMV